MCKKFMPYLQLVLLPRCKQTAALVSCIFAILSAVYALFGGQSTNKPEWPTVALIICASLWFLLEFFIHLLESSKRTSYRSKLKREELSGATLSALQKADEAKTKYILQSTYGQIPQWRPTNYLKNVLTYDVHEHIRTILYNIQNMILDTIDGINRDQIVVDFVYCYPKEDDYNGELPIPSVWASSKHWRLITSGSHSLSGSMQSYLASSNSFYNYVNMTGYSFFNDKSKIPTGNYIPSSKDKVWEQKSSMGSIVGLVVELKNDQPETTFIKGILTITTFGETLYDKKREIIKQSVFEDIFFETIILSFKQLILGELAQMFIRHAIKNGDMCPRTGALIEDQDKKSKRNWSICRRTCMATGKMCKFSTGKCEFRRGFKLLGEDNHDCLK